MKYLLLLLLIVGCRNKETAKPVYVIRAFQNTGNWDSVYLYSDGHLKIVEQPNVDGIYFGKIKMDRGVTDTVGWSKILLREANPKNFTPSFKPKPIHHKHKGKLLELGSDKGGYRIIDSTGKEGRLIPFDSDTATHNKADSGLTIYGDGGYSIIRDVTWKSTRFNPIPKDDTIKLDTTFKRHSILKITK